MLGSQIPFQCHNLSPIPILDSMYIEEIWKDGNGQVQTARPQSILPAAHQKSNPASTLTTPDLEVRKSCLSRAPSQSSLTQTLTLTLTLTIVQPALVPRLSSLRLGGATLTASLLGSPEIRSA